MLSGPKLYGTHTFSALALLDNEQILSNSNSVLLVRQKLHNLSSFRCVDLDIDLCKRTETPVNLGKVGCMNLVVPPYLVGFDGRNFFICSDAVANLL